VEEISNEIFSILKGANYKLRLFTNDGTKTIDASEATRFYAYDQDLMITIRQKGGNIEIVAQAGVDYDIPENSELLDSIKSVAHRNLGEYTVRKFSKNIAPKDFAHQSVTEGKAFGKSYGSIKTSYIPAPKAKIIIKHSDKVNEEKRGARSRNIHSIFIENTQGEKFNFPYGNIKGAKAMAFHVSEGGTPYDERGQAIISMCEDLKNINTFVKHVKSNKLVNEGNEDVISTVREAASSIKNKLHSLSTQKGYNNFTIGENTEEKSVDLSEKFMYNVLEAEEIAYAVSTVSRIVAEKNEKESMSKDILKRLGDLISSNVDLKLSLDKNDPEHPNNEDPIKYSGGEGPVAYLSNMLSLIATRSKNDEASNLFAELSSRVYDLSSEQKQLVAKVVDFIEKKYSGATESTDTTEVGLVESTMLGLRKKIA
jgi:hypothetical protein